MPIITICVAKQLYPTRNIGCPCSQLGSIFHTYCTGADSTHTREYSRNTKLQILSQVFIQITTFQALPSKVSSFLDNSSCNSENMVPSSFDDGSGIFCKAIAPAHPPVVVRQYLPVLATGKHRLLSRYKAPL